VQDGQLKVGDSDREIMARNCPEGSTLTDDCNCISNEGFVEGNECPEGYEKIQHNGGPACQRTTSKMVMNPDNEKIVTAEVGGGRGIQLGGQVGIAAGVVSALFAAYGCYKRTRNKPRTTQEGRMEQGMTMDGQDVNAGSVARAAASAAGFDVPGVPGMPGMPQMPRNGKPQMPTPGKPQMPMPGKPQMPTPGKPQMPMPGMPKAGAGSTKSALQSAARPQMPMPGMPTAGAGSSLAALNQAARRM